MRSNIKGKCLLIEWRLQSSTSGRDMPINERDIRVLNNSVTESPKGETKLTHQGEKIMFRFKTIAFLIVVLATILSACQPAAPAAT